MDLLQLKIKHDVTKALFLYYVRSAKIARMDIREVNHENINKRTLCNPHDAGSGTA